MYELDWKTGRIRFGDGANESLPPASTEYEYDYTTTPDVIRYGSSGSGTGEFDQPSGIAARWNSVSGAFDVYVADAGNHRIQKLVFWPEDPLLQLPARLDSQNLEQMLGPATAESHGAAG